MQYFYLHRVHVHNRAEGGTSAHWALNRVHALLSDVGGPGDLVDLVVVEYDVNDCALFGDTAAERGKVGGCFSQETEATTAPPASGTSRRMPARPRGPCPPTL